MIKFFRKIRKTLLSENKLSKYLIYALGEIFLVVIGILIAISMNNQNQQQSDKIDRDTKLTKLRHTIYNDSIAFSNSIANSKTIIKKIDSIQQMLQSDLDFDGYKSFVNGFKEIDFSFRTFQPNRTVYNELINSASFSKIEQQELKESISTLYGYYDHFGNLISDFTKGFIATNNNLYSGGTISYKYYNLDLTDNELLQGHEEFKSILQDPQRRRILENYIYSQRQVHSSIIGLYQFIIFRFMKGLPLSPEKTN